MRHYSTYQSQFIEMFWGGKYTMKKLRGHIEVLRGVSYKPSDVHEDHSDNTSIVLRSNNIDGGQVNFDDLVYVDSERVSEHQVLNAGDIVMCGSNGSKKLVGKAALLNETPRENTSFGAFCLGIRCKSSIIPEYLATYFQTSLYRDKIEALGSGSNILNIKPDHIYDLEIPIPSLGEQETFVSIVKQADKSKFTRLKSQFIEMFEGEKYPRLSLDEICKEWSKGQGFKKDDICEDGETQCIHYGELFTKYGPVINEVVSRTSVEKKKTSKKGDILFPASDVTPNGLARCSMLPFDNVILGGDIIILRPKDNYNAAYLSYAINQQTSQLLTRVNGGVVKHMSAKGLKTIEIPIPPIDKQGEYIQIAEQADKSKYIN